MFLKRCERRKGGKKHTYWVLVESYRTPRGSRHRVVARTDIVRIFVDVPEIDASYVVRGTKATVRIHALDDLDLSSGVTCTSWALNVKSRTLRAEIDLRNPDARLVPGMYAYGNVLIERPKARVLPRAAIVEQGNQQVCFLYQNGKVAKTPVQFGVSDGTWVEMLKKRVGDTWAEFDGSEQVALGDLANMSDGQTVRVDSEKLTRISIDSQNVDSPCPFPFADRAGAVPIHGNLALDAGRFR